MIERSGSGSIPPYPGGPKVKNMWIRIRNYGRKYYKLSTSERVLFLKESADFVDAGKNLL
jgi:hypothetical protein